MDEGSLTAPTGPIGGGGGGGSRTQVWVKGCVVVKSRGSRMICCGFGPL